MFGFLKKKPEDEHFRLIAECKQMAKRLLDLHRIAWERRRDFQSLIKTSELDELKRDLNEKQARVERVEALPVDEAQELLELHKVLSVQLSGMEARRKVLTS